METRSSEAAFPPSELPKGWGGFPGTLADPQGRRAGGKVGEGAHSALSIPWRQAYFILAQDSFLVQRPKAFKKRREKTVLGHQMLLTNTVLMV